jgi:hypothetical protein
MEIAPGHARATYRLCGCLIAEGHPEEALALATRSGVEWIQLTCTAMAEHDLGHARESQAALDALLSRYASWSAYQVAQVLAWRGERDRAFEWMERAFAQRDMGLMATEFDPLLRKLDGDPRWKPFLAKMGMAAD